MDIVKIRGYISEKILKRIIKFLFIAFILFFPYSISIREILVGLLFIFYILNRLISWNFSLINTPFDNEIIIYLLFSVLSLLKVDNLLIGVEEIIVSPFKYIALFYMAYDLIKKDEVQKFFNVLFIGSFSLLAVGKVVYFQTGKNYIGGNGAGTWATFSIFLFFYFLLIKKESIFKKSISIIGIILGINILFTTSSRGAVLGFFSGILITFFMFVNTKIKNKKRLYAIFFLFITIILISVPFLLPERLVSKFERIKNISSNWSLKTRVIMWKSSLHYIIQNPLLGVGIGDYQTNYLNYIDNILKIDVPRGSRMHDHPHNLFLYIAVEQGIISLAVFLIMLFRGFKIAYYNINKFKKNNRNNYYGLVLIGMLISLIVHSMVDTTFRYGHVAYFVMLFTIFNTKILTSREESVNFED